MCSNGFFAKKDINRTPACDKASYHAFTVLKLQERFGDLNRNDRVIEAVHLLSGRPLHVWTELLSSATKMHYNVQNMTINFKSFQDVMPSEPILVKAYSTCRSILKTPTVKLLTLHLPTQVPTGFMKNTECTYEHEIDAKRKEPRHLASEAGRDCQWKNSCDCRGWTRWRRRLSDDTVRLCVDNTGCTFKHNTLISSDTSSQHDSLESLHWFSQRRSPTPHSAEIVVQCTSPPQSFIILCLLVRKLSCWQTNKQTLLKTSNALRYAKTLGNYFSSPGPRCKSKTGHQKQDRSCHATNHRRSWRDQSRPVLDCNTPLAELIEYGGQMLSVCLSRC